MQSAGKYVLLAIATLGGVGLCGSRTWAADDSTVQRLRSGNTELIRQASSDIRYEVQRNPTHAVDRLNEDWMMALLSAKQYRAVEEFAVVVQLGARCPTGSALSSDAPG